MPRRARNLGSALEAAAMSTPLGTTATGTCRPSDRSVVASSSEVAWRRSAAARFERSTSQNASCFRHRPWRIAPRCSMPRGETTYGTLRPRASRVAVHSGTFQMPWTWQRSTRGSAARNGARIAAPKNRRGKRSGRYRTGTPSYMLPSAGDETKSAGPFAAVVSTSTCTPARCRPLQSPSTLRGGPP